MKKYFSEFEYDINNKEYQLLFDCDDWSKVECQIVNLGDDFQDVYIKEIRTGGDNRNLICDEDGFVHHIDPNLCELKSNIIYILCVSRVTSSTYRVCVCVCVSTSFAYYVFFDKSKSSHIDIMDSSELNCECQVGASR